jgi:hypothetical protein
VLLEQVPRTGAVYAALHLGWAPGGHRVEARLLIAIRRFGPSTDPIALLGALRAGPDERHVALVQFGETVVVRQAGLVDGHGGPTVVHHQYYFPVPGDEDRLALLDFSSPTITAAADLGDMFESMAASFRFTDS